MSSSALSWPKRERWTGQTYWLSAGQRSLLFWLEARMARGWHTFTLDDASAAVGVDRSNISRGLDRLASLSLIGRRSRPGRGHRTVVWRIHKNRALAERARRAAPDAGRNVATSTPYGGYLSREALASAPGGSGRGSGSARRLAPPRLLYARCPAGHRVRLARWSVRRFPDGRADGTWTGWCRRCASWTGTAVTMQLRTDPREQLAERRRDRALAVASGSMDVEAFRDEEARDRRSTEGSMSGAVAALLPALRPRP